MSILGLNSLITVIKMQFLKKRYVRLLPAGYATSVAVVVTALLTYTGRRPRNNARSNKLWALRVNTDYL
jgi:peptidoglycan/LPS O-acetylase OafA/YrhL